MTSELTEENQEEQQTRSATISLRLTEKEAQKFKEYATTEGISQADFLLSLLSLYVPNNKENANERPQQQKDDTDSNEQNNRNDDKVESTNNSIDLMLCMKNSLVEKSDFEKYNKETRKYKFIGEVLYWPQTFFTQPMANCESCLRKEFGIKNEVDLSSFAVYHVLNLLKYEKKTEQQDQYLVNEVIRLSKTDNWEEIPLWISRCRKVSGYREIADYYSELPYVSRQNLLDIEWILAKTVREEDGGIEGIFEEYF